MDRKLKETISVQEAMDNLASIAGIHLEDLPRIGIVKGARIVVGGESSEGVEWLKGEGADSLLELVDASYQAIHQHLVKLYEDGEVNWENEKIRKGIAAMMSLVGDAADKMDGFLKLSLGKALEKPVSQRESFKALQKFYTQQFVSKFPGGIEGEEAWSEEWSENGEAILFDATKSGLKDFETVRLDTEYELFYIRNEEGKPYFTPELLRNIRLSCHFDVELEELEEDPLLKVRAMQDRDLHASAGQILGECHAPISDFYKVARKLEGNELAQSLGMAVNALFLAANPRYLLQNTIAKSCLQYYEDFHRFLRRAMKTSEYQKLIAYPPDRSDKTSELLLYLTHALCKGFFERVGGVKLESIGLIHRMMRRGEEVKRAQKKHLLKGETVWNQFLLDDEKYRSLLAKFPNGPLFKVLDLIHEEQDEGAIIPFDPMAQGNLPVRVYDVQRKGKRIEVLRFPAPVRQGLIHKVEISDEFRGFLRALAQGQKHLMIHLEDRTSWREYARCSALETLQMHAEFNQHLLVITLPKNTDFYFQTNEYTSLDRAEDFLKALQEQLKAPEECGYFFPPAFKRAALSEFVEQVLPAIHAQFFEKKKELSRQDRQIFIEIFYQFLVLKAIDLLEPTSLSFTCKDGIDLGAAQQGSFYGFLKLLTEDFTEKEEQDFLRWLLYMPALLIRERAIHAERFHKTVSLLEWVDLKMAERGKEVLKSFSTLYHPQTFKTLGVKHL